MNILFIGNSHTFCNGLPFQARELLRTRVPDVEVAMLATSGVTLGWHAEQPETQMAIQYQEWDTIVLQQKSHPFDGYRALLKDCRALLPLIRKTEAEILLFMTWAEKRNPAGQAVLDRAFIRVAGEIGARPLPVSKAWCALQQSDPDIELYEADGEHASPAGSYLAACVCFAVIQKEPPLGLPEKLIVGGDVLVSLPGDQAGRIQRAAWSVC